MEQLPAGDEAREVEPILVAEDWPELRDARKSVRPEYIAEIRDLLTEKGFFQHFTEWVVEWMEECEPVALKVEPDADEGPIEPEAVRVASAQALRDLYMHLVGAGTNESFRTHFTHDALAHTAAWAMGELIRSVPREQLLAMDEEAFEQAYNQVYFSKSNLPQAVLALLPAYMEGTGQAILDAIVANPDAPNIKNHLETAYHEALQGLASTRLAGAMPNVVEDGHIQFNATQVAFALLTAIHDAGSGKGWDDFNGQRAPTHTTWTGKKSKEPGQIYVTVRGKQEDIVPDTATLNNLWESLGKLDDLTSDVLLVCLATCTKAGGAAWVNVDALLDARGLKRIQKKDEPGNWQHGHRTEDRVAVGRALEQLDTLWIEVQNVDLKPSGKRRKSQRFSHESRALAVVDRVMQRDLEGGKVVRAARVVLGSWVDMYRDAEITQLGTLAQKALAYDPHNHKAEKRLAKYLAFHYKYNPNRPVIRRKVRDLLETATIPADAARPKRPDERLTKALNRLQEDGVIGTWRPVIDPAERAARGWFAPWLESMIEIEQPPFIQSRYAKIRS